MPITPPLDNKQEPAEYTTDQVGPDLDRDTLIRLLKEHPLDKMVKDVDDRFPRTIEKALSEAARVAEEATRWEGDPDIQIFRDPPDFKRDTHGAWPVHKSKFTMDEIKENFKDFEPFVSSQRISMHQVAAAMKALAHKGELTEEELECKQKD